MSIEKIVIESHKLQSLFNIIEVLSMIHSRDLMGFLNEIKKGIVPFFEDKKDNSLDQKEIE